MDCLEEDLKRSAKMTMDIARKMFAEQIYKKECLRATGSMPEMGRAMVKLFALPTDREQLELRKNVLCVFAEKNKELLHWTFVEFVLKWAKRLTDISGVCDHLTAKQITRELVDVLELDCFQDDLFFLQFRVKFRNSNLAVYDHALQWKIDQLSKREMEQQESSFETEQQE